MEVSTKPNKQQESIDLFGMSIWNPDYQEFKDWWDVQVYDKKLTTLLGIANAHTLNLACKRPEFAKRLRAFDRMINDGFGMSLGASFQGKSFKYNFNGTDLFPRLFSESEKKLKVFLYGASEISNEGAAEKIRAEYPNVEVVGNVHGFVDPVREALPQIRESNADLLLVALGQPKQEDFLYVYRKQLNVGIACGVGALFDFLSGQVDRAPMWVRKIRMEWAYRLKKEPKRMFHRYVIGNPEFLIRSFGWSWHLRRERRKG